jgi:hypothetical protein
MGENNTGGVFLHLGRSFIDSLKADQIKRKLYSLLLNGRKVDQSESLRKCLVFERRKGRAAPEVFQVFFLVLRFIRSVNASH